MTQPVRHVSVNIERPFETVAEFLGDPSNYPGWATGLAAGVEPGSAGSGAEDGEWVAEAPEGTAFVRFSPPNNFGVADHQVRFPDGLVISIPLRAIRNGAGTTVVLTVLRRPDMDDAQFDADGNWVQRDLAALKSRLEG